MESYDVIVIGSGQGGNPLAHTLADRGRRVALVEREHLGGTCVNYGCTPTKTMVASARIAHYARRAADFGVHAGPVTVDLAAVVRRKQQMVEQWRSGQQQAVDERQTLDLYRGHARFTGPHTLDVDGAALRSEQIVIDVGTRPRLPEIDGIDAVEVLTNRTILELTALPEHLLVLGGGYIGLEFGQMFRRFGSRVTIIDRNARILRREDEDVTDALHEALAEEGIAFRLGAKAQKIEATESGFALTLEGAAEPIDASHLLAATGRIPNTDDLGLQAAGIETDDRGFIRVDARLRTSVEGVWALGDVTGGPAFTHLSFDDHFIVLDDLDDAANPRTTDDRLTPYAVYTDPELGRVGLTEREAKEQGYACKVGSIPMEKVARAKERGETAGLMKIVVDAETDRILGAAVLGPEGGELVQLFTTAMRAGAPWTVFRRAVYIHPTLAEGFYALMENVEDRD